MSTQTAEPATTLDELDGAWDQFFGAVRRARGRAARDQSAGLSLSQFHLLSPLTDFRSLPVGALAEAAGISGPTATRMLDGLVRDGLVERENSTADRRVVTVSLTRKGKRVVERKRAHTHERRHAAFEQLTDREREQAAAILRRLALVVEDL
jgi:MarR family transcriptional regulator, organic hydroperoxide resistance regulator